VRLPLEEQTLANERPPANWIKFSDMHFRRLSSLHP
jgi:hypothetical protein